VTPIEKPELVAFLQQLSKPKKWAPPKKSLRSPVGVLAFFEKSTRTRFSFEKAGLDLGVRWISFDPETSSLGKGESLEESFRTLQIYQPDFYVVRHPEAGFSDWVQKWTEAPVFNAGDGCHEHPTQALGDAWALWKRGLKKSLKISFYGDVSRSRVARSCIQVFRKLGHSLSWVPNGDSEGVEFAKAFDLPLLPPKKIREQDIVYALRTQTERGGIRTGAALRLEDLGPKTFWMHPGPVVQTEDLAWNLCQFDHPRCLIRDQVAAGYEVRKEILGQSLGLFS
jgi:aspartate carbamoyltransferase catalytic subunit